jgi:hypothetical protein
MSQLTEWLKLMVAEIDRKRDDAERAKQEETARQKDASPPQQKRAQASRRA